MRLPHHLLKSKTGIWSFRLIVPADLHLYFGKKVIKRTLGTRDPAKARAYAYELGAQYARAIAQARGFAGENGRMSSSTNGPGRYSGFEIRQHEDGGYSVSTDGTPGDNSAALEALRVLERMSPQAAQLAALYGSQRLKAPTSPAAPPTPTLEEAFALYASVEGPTQKPDTWAQRQRAMKSFIEAIGPTTRVDAVTRPMAAVWATDLQKAGLSKRTAALMVSHVAQLFDAQIRGGHIRRNENPVKGVIVFKKSDKKAARDSGRGWEPLSHDQLKLIFHPENFKRTRTIHVRWGALIGIYTGARVGEVAQLFLRDFEEVDGVKCVRITAESDGQSIKTESSRRLVPLHPDLLALGLWDRVERLRKEGVERLFPDMRIDSKSGAGNAISKGFSYYIATLGVKPRRANGTVGFHSLRKTVIQELQGSNLPAERRRALVGHEAGEDVHETDYMRAWKADELAVFFPGLARGFVDLLELRTFLG